VLNNIVNCLLIAVKSGYPGKLKYGLRLLYSIVYFLSAPGNPYFCALYAQQPKPEETAKIAFYEFHHDSANAKFDLLKKSLAAGIRETLQRKLDFQPVEEKTAGKVILENGRFEKIPHSGILAAAGADLVITGKIIDLSYPGEIRVDTVIYTKTGAYFIVLMYR